MKRELGLRETEQKFHLFIQSITSRFPWLRRRSLIYFQELMVNGSPWAELWECDGGMYSRNANAAQKLQKETVRRKIRATAAAPASESGLACYQYIQRLLIYLYDWINPWYGKLHQYYCRKTRDAFLLSDASIAQQSWFQQHFINQIKHAWFTIFLLPQKPVPYLH